MKKFFLFAFICWGSMGIGQELNIEDPVRFLALGDSYTIGQSVAVDLRWPVQLADSLEGRGFSVDTVGIIATTGWRTDQLLNAISGKGLADRNFNLVSLLIGVNNQYQGGIISTYEAEFRELLDSAVYFAGGEVSRVFVVSIPDYAYTPFGQNANPQEISGEIDAFNEVNRAVALEYGIDYFNITPISREGLDRPDLVASDNLHPSGLQYTEWVEFILQPGVTTSTGNPPGDSRTMEIYPNPFQEKINIRGYVSSAMNIELYTLLGERVFRQPLTGEELSLSLADLNNGLYFCILVTDSGEVLQRDTLLKVP